MSSKVVGIVENDDVKIKFLIEGQTVLATITREAFEGVIQGADSYSEMSNNAKENLVSSILVWLSNEEAHARLDAAYVFNRVKLNQLLGQM